MTTWLCALLGIAAASLALPAAAITVPPLADYGKLPAADNVHLSPQGDKVAYLAFAQGKRVIAVSAIGMCSACGARTTS